MKVASRLLLAGAAVALVAGLLLGALPVKVHPADGPPTAGGQKIICGAAFSQTDRSHDDACEGPLLNRFGATLAAFAASVVLFVLGAGALVVSMNRRLRHPVP